MPTPRFVQRLRRLLAVPDQLDRMETLMSDNSSALDRLESAAQRNGQATAAAVAGLTDLRTKIGALESEVASGRLDQSRLAAITASIDASSDSVAQALAPVVDDPDVPTPGVETPPAENPATESPADVDGSVPAGEPLPDDLTA